MIIKENTPLLTSSTSSSLEHGNKDTKIGEKNETKIIKNNRIKKINHLFYNFFQTFLSPPVILGSIISSLYHVVYALALASAINRRHGTTSLIGVIAKMAVIGTVSGASIQIAFLGKSLPSLYPSVDRFMIPLLVEVASCVDESLYEQAMKEIHLNKNEEIAKVLLSDNTFLATFSSLAAFGLFLSSMFCFLAYSIKLANLGAFLPNAVISGFFSTIGLLLFQFAFSVDNNGLKVSDFFSKYLLSSIIGDADNNSGSSDENRINNKQIVFQCILHFIPSVIVGIIIRLCAPMHQLSTPLIIIGVVGGVYIFMALMGITLEEAQANHWFWTKDELIYDDTSQVSFF